jgi:hypothetical protein
VRILYVGASQGFENAAKYYFTPQKLINGFTRLGHNVYMFNERDVARYSNVFRSQSFGRKAMNEKLIADCRSYRPEMIVLGHCKNVTNDTLAEIRTICPGVRIIYRNVDPLHAENNVRDIRQRVGQVEAIFITTAGEALRQFAHPDTKTCFMPNPVDPALETERAYANPDADIDFLFLGSILRDQYDHRQDTLRHLAQNDAGLKVYLGGGQGDAGRVFGAAYYALLGRSKMGLCMNKTADYYLYASGRMSQYMGSGMLGFIPEGPRFEDILGDDAFVSYKTDEELIDKIRFYAANDTARIALAERGCTRIHDYFHVDKVCRYMIERAFDRDISQDYRWPVTTY